MENPNLLSEDQVSFALALGFLITIFEPEMYKLWNRKPAIRKNHLKNLKLHLNCLTEQMLEQFSNEKIRILKKDIKTYIEISELAATESIIFRICEHKIFLPRQAGKIYTNSCELISKYC